MSEVEGNVEHKLPKIISKVKGNPNQRKWSATTSTAKKGIFRGIVVPP